MTITTDAIARLDALDPEQRAIAVGAYGRDPAVDDTDSEGERLTAILDALDAGAGNLAAIEALAKADPYAGFDDPADIPLTSMLLRERIKRLTDAERDLFVEAWKGSGLPMRLADDEGADVLMEREAYRALEGLLAEHEPRPTDTTMSEANGALITALSDAERRVLEERLAAISIDPKRVDYFSTCGRQYAVNRMATMWTEELAAKRADAEARKASVPSEEPTAVTTTPVADEEDLANTVPEGLTMADLLTWVGEDKARATKALAAEEARAKPRKGVVARCNVVLATSTTEEPTALAAPKPEAEPEDEDATVIDIATGKEVVTDPEAYALESPLFRSVPTSEWSPLMVAAYCSRLSAELEVASKMLADLAAVANKNAGKA